MKTATTLGLAALLATAGTAVADGPIALTDAQLDQVTAGLLLPAIQAAPEAARRDHAEVANVLVSAGAGDDTLILTVGQIPLQGTVGPRLGLSNLARSLGRD